VSEQLSSHGPLRKGSLEPVGPIFVSSSRADFRFVEDLEAFLKLSGHMISNSRDTISVSESFEDQLEKQIHASPNFVFVLSEDSIESSVCRYEVELAVQQEKRIFVVTPGPVPSYLKIPTPIVERRWVHCYSDPSHVGSSQTQGFAQLEAALSGHDTWKESVASKVLSRSEVETILQHTDEAPEEAFLEEGEYDDLQFEFPTEPESEESGFTKIQARTTEADLNDYQYDVFLSYARAEADAVQPICDWLTSAGLKVFYDLDEIEGGDEFPKRIEDALRTSRTVIACFSEIYFTRRWCKVEVNWAWEAEILIPVLIEDFEVPIQFRTTNYINLSDWQGESQHPNLRKLRTAIKKTSGSQSSVQIESAPISNGAAPISAHMLGDLRETWGTLKKSKDKSVLKRFFKLVEKQAPDSGLAFEVALRIGELRK